MKVQNTPATSFTLQVSVTTTSTSVPSTKSFLIINTPCSSGVGSVTSPAITDSVVWSISEFFERLDNVNTVILYEINNSRVLDL